MDQLKKILAVLKKYHFWIICVVVLLTGIVCWWLATAGVAEEFQQRAAKVQKAFADANVSASTPNQAVIDKVEEETKRLKQNVDEAWQLLYAQQKQLFVLPSTSLPAEFRQAFERLKPGEELRFTYLSQYQRYIKDELAELAKIIDIRRQVADPAVENGAAAGGAGMAAGPAGPSSEQMRWVGTVEWNQTDYDQMMMLFTWENTRPSTLSVLIRQEDYWIYQAILNIIKTVNGKDATYTTAAVRRIDSIRIGPDAALVWKEPGTARTVREGAGSTAQDTSARGALSRDVSGLEGAAAEKKLLLDGRYVDDKGSPLQADAAAHPEFKMIPVHMRFVVAQGTLPKLLSECANAKLPIEVRRVRVELAKDESKQQSSGPGDLASGLEAPMPTAGESPMASAAGGTANSSLQGHLYEASQHNILADICGVIHLYNPPPAPGGTP